MQEKRVNPNYILLSFIVSLSATLGSLFFSEIMQFVPCSMCWYQRIFMYPLVFIFLINLLYPDDKIFKYTFIIILIGLTFSIYHNLLMFGIISEDMVPCVQGVPCSTIYLDWFGFITIPLLSFVAYFLLFILQLMIYKNLKEK
ncbi:MAG: disulfide bond formation protein B [Arcobacter sp.]|uniref:disulfide oxidoreductase n=1 Tax=uncultured Arcobacter sp. TaxID=165434 RepID=UPI000CC5F011|nr:disulfide oxidoreductase [uncultured Arcobacter sp.]PLY08986.1 MAG: disulfide bond formation protein B [Arcobacter sp.]